MERRRAHIFGDGLFVIANQGVSMGLQVLRAPAIKVAFILVMLQQLLFFRCFCLHLRSGIFILLCDVLVITLAGCIRGRRVNLGSVKRLRRRRKRIQQGQQSYYECCQIVP